MMTRMHQTKVTVSFENGNVDITQQKMNQQDKPETLIMRKCSDYDEKPESLVIRTMYMHVT